MFRPKFNLIPKPLSKGYPHDHSFDASFGITKLKHNPSIYKGNTLLILIPRQYDILESYIKKTHITNEIQNNTQQPSETN